MSKRQPIKTTIQQAVDYWSERIYEGELSVDWSEADTHCWRCGCQKNLERCHIVPDSLGGKDEPANIVLLCKRCHAEGPNVSDIEIMWDWIRAYKVPFYETFWMFKGMEEYEFIYKKSLFSEMIDIIISAGISENAQQLQQVEKMVMTSLSEILDGASTHYGQPYFNSATLAGCYRMMLKELANSLGVCFPAIALNEEKAKHPWWLKHSWWHRT